MPDSPDTPRLSRAIAFQVLLLTVTLAALWIIRDYGEAIAPTPGVVVAAAADPAPQDSPLMHVLLTLVVVMITGRLLGRALARIHQPPVIGEVAAGILLGPSLLGWIAPGVEAYLLPPGSGPYLGIVAQLGIVLYMFMVGLEFDAALVYQRGQTTISIAWGGMLVPFVLGASLALWAYPTLAGPGVSFSVFALFLGVAMSVTAFPVLARILTDRGLHTTELGLMALACAATDDVSAWCLLALIVGIAQARVDQSLFVVGGTIAYIALMFVVVRPLLDSWAPKPGSLNRRTVVPVFAAIFLSAAATEWIGVHAVFGAFLLGAVIPCDSSVARQFRDKYEDLITVVFLPAFFAITGMHTEIGLLDSGTDWLWCLLIVGVASLGKLGGILAVARFNGLAWRDATALGVLMNTRGLMEIIVLNMGLELRVISPRLYAMMVLMALVTTMATTPALQMLQIGPRRSDEAKPLQESKT